MPVTSHDIQLIAAAARYYVLTRDQLQRICFPDHASGRTTRKRLCKLQKAGYVQKHRMPVAFPGSASAAPVYYLTRKGAELLASWYDDSSYLASNTRQPRGDRLNHWIAVNETRLIVEAAIAQQSVVSLVRWVNEWETCNKDDAEKLHFSLHTQLSEQPPLSCSPDAGFLLAIGNVSKVYYLEQDLGTSSPKQVAARKTKGYEALAAGQGHRRHFPESTVEQFGVLFITTTRYRCEEAAKQIAKRPRPDLWLFINQHDLNADSFLHGAITWNHQREIGPLVSLPSATPTEEAAT